MFCFSRVSLFRIVFSSFFFLTLQYCIGFCHISTWIHHRCTRVPSPEPPPTTHPITSLWVIPVHQPQAFCILNRTWTGDLFLIWYYTCFNAILPNHPPPNRVHVLYLLSSQWDQGDRGLMFTESLGSAKHFSYYLAESIAALNWVLPPLHSEEPAAQRVNKTTWLVTQLGDNSGDNVQTRLSKSQVTSSSTLLPPLTT